MCGEVAWAWGLSASGHCAAQQYQVGWGKGEYKAAHYDKDPGWWGIILIPSLGGLEQMP